MISNVNNYFVKFVGDLIFINIEENKLKNEFGIANKDVLLPIKKTEIINMAKDDYQNLTGKQIIDGILYIMGADTAFKWNKDYSDFLNRKIKNIEKIVKSEILEDIKNQKLDIGALKLRAYLNFINSRDNEATTYYASLCKEIYSKATNKFEMKDFYKEAKFYFEKAIEIDGENVLAAFELAYFNRAERNLEKAKILMEMVRLNTKDQALLEDATIFLEDLDTEMLLEESEELLKDGEIIEALNILLKINPIPQGLKYKWLFNKGFCYKMLGDADMALENYEEAVQINNMDPRLLAELGMVYGYLGEFDQALEFYYSALNFEPKNIAILCNLAIVMMNIGDIDKAREYVKRALELDDKDEIAISCVKELRKFE